jgi:DNA-binding transcriptional MerR regulator
MEHLKRTFRKNGYNTTQIKQALHQKNKHKTPQTKPANMAITPYMQNISGKINKLLQNIIPNYALTGKETQQPGKTG